MGMLNKDLELSIEELLAKAIGAENEEDFVKYQLEATKVIEGNIIAEAKKITEEQLSDQNVLAERGLRVLTTAETKYYNAVISDGSFKGKEELMPVTVIDRIFKDLEAQHPLLTKIQLVNTTGITRWLGRKADAEGAVWGKLGSEITKMLDNSFEVIDTQLNKLSAFVPLSKDMLGLGPVWLDKFVRAILQESIAIGLEKAIIEGTGVDQPIGMLKDITGLFNQTTGYPDRKAVVLPDLTPTSLGKLVMKPLVDGKVKTVQNVILVCNPGDYWEKIFPQTTMQDLNGNYVFNKLPIAADIVQSVYVPAGKMIACIPEDYFMGIGFNSMIQFSDEYHFLEDERIYITKMAGHGKPIEAKSFLTFDISKLGVPETGTGE